MFSKYDMIYVPIFYWSPIAIITSPSARSLFSVPSVSIRSVHIPSGEILASSIPIVHIRSRHIPIVHIPSGTNS